MWKIQVAQSSNSQSCCKDRQVPLELLLCCFEGVLKLKKQYSNSLFRGKNVSSVQHVAPTMAQYPHFAVCSRDWSVFYTNDKISKRSKPSRPAPSGCSVQQQSSGAGWPGTFSCLRYRRTCWTRFCFSIHFCYCTVYSRQAVKCTKLHQRQTELFGKKKNQTLSCYLLV